MPLFQTLAKFAARAALLAIPLTFIMCSNEDTTPNPVPADPSQLQAPPKGQGLQFGTPEQPVGANEEVQNCFFFKASELAASGGLDPAAPFYLHRIHVVQRLGTHHMNLFRVKTIVGLDPNAGRQVLGKNGQGECFKSPNWSDWPLIANTQIGGGVDWTYPDGVANEFQPDEWLMVQSHYVNGSSQKTPAGAGKVAINFWTIPKTEVTAQLGTIFATKQSIRICSKNPTPSFDGTCQVRGNQPVTIIGANAHFHSRGKSFSMFSWDGTSTARPDQSAKFYQSNDWAEPPMSRSPDLNLKLQPGGGIWYTCDFQWQPPPPEVGCQGLNDFDTTKYKTPPENLDCCYTFGPIVDKNEHCNIFVYYYPKLEGGDAFCN